MPVLIKKLSNRNGVFNTCNAVTSLDLRIKQSPTTHEDFLANQVVPYEGQVLELASAKGTLDQFYVFEVLNIMEERTLRIEIGFKLKAKGNAVLVLRYFRYLATPLAYLNGLA